MTDIIHFLNNYITELGQLIQEIEQTAKMECDMTPQRYGINAWCRI